RGIVEACKARGVRVFICSAAVTAADPDKSENDFLQQMCDDGMKISTSAGEGAIDLERAMREGQLRIKAAKAAGTDPKKHETMHAADGIHLNELGQTAMAYAMLKGLGAPADVSAVTIDAAAGIIVAASGCAVSDVAVKEGGVEFTRKDDGLPLNFG